MSYPHVSHESDVLIMETDVSPTPSSLSFHYYVKEEPSHDPPVTSVWSTPTDAPRPCDTPGLEINDPDVASGSSHFAKTGLRHPL